MLSTPHSFLRKVSMRVSMTADNHEVDILVSKERIWLSIVLDVRVIYCTVLALRMIGRIGWWCSTL